MKSSNPVKNITSGKWERFKKRFNRHFDYGGMRIHRQDVLNYIGKYLLSMKQENPVAEQIKSPRIGTVVRHTGWQFENDKDYPCDVLIIDGQYMGDGRLSNFWYWRRILPDGSLSETEYGYGSFEKAERNYEIKTMVKCVGDLEPKL